MLYLFFEICFTHIQFPIKFAINTISCFSRIIHRSLVMNERRCRILLQIIAKSVFQRRRMWRYLFSETNSNLESAVASNAHSIYQA